MISEIVKDVFLLSQKSLPAQNCPADMKTAQDLIDTLNANREVCVGMAANMIGVKKRIIIASIHETFVVMFNPVIVQKEKPYETQEGCLSLEGTRECTRFKNITVEYSDLKWKKQTKRFSGFSAQIILHEMDHLEGIVI